MGLQQWTFNNPSTTPALALAPHYPNRCTLAYFSHPSLSLPLFLFLKSEQDNRLPSWRSSPSIQKARITLSSVRLFILLYAKRRCLNACSYLFCCPSDRRLSNSQNKVYCLLKNNLGWWAGNWSCQTDHISCLALKNRRQITDCFPGSTENAENKEVKRILLR